MLQNGHNERHSAHREQLIYNGASFLEDFCDELQQFINGFSNPWELTIHKIVWSLRNKVYQWNRSLRDLTLDDTSILDVEFTNMEKESPHFVAHLILVVD